MKILFVCLGNICRSPLAEGIARSLSSKHTFDSAGTGHWHIGEPPCEKSQNIAKIKGIDISNLRARQLCENDLKKWDKIVVMDERNLKDTKKMGFTNVFKLLNKDIPDPYFYDSEEGMDALFEMIKKGVEIMLKSLD
jgi:protein-tyrosine phosphatase